MIGVLWIASVLALIWAQEENSMCGYCNATSILRFFTGRGDSDGAWLKANGVAAEGVMGTGSEGLGAGWAYAMEERGFPREGTRGVGK